jgi:competence protein ComEC
VPVEPDTESAETVGATAPTDLRLVPVAAVVWAIAWVTPILPGAAAPIVALAAAVTIGGLLVRRGRRAGAVTWVLIACLVAGSATALACGVRLQAGRAGPLPDLAEQRAVVEVTARVTGYPQVFTPRPRHGPSRPAVVVPVRIERMLGRGRVSRIRSPVLLYSTDLTWRRVLPGERYATGGRLAPARSHAGAVAVLWAHRPGARLGTASWPHRWAAAVRADLHTAVAGLPAGPRALVPGLVVGDTSAVDPAATAEFKVSGLTHLTAVSGANVAILLVVVLGLAGRLGVSRRLRPVLGGTAVLGFLLVVGPAPSLLRAAVMGAVGLVGLAVGRPARAVPALCAAVILLLLVDPALARNYSFALSSAATAALIGLAPRWRDALARYVPVPVATALAVPAAAQVACAPLIVLLSGNVSLIAIPANLLVAPVVAPAMICGLLAAAAQPLSPDLAALLARPAGACAAWILTVAHRCAELPGATLPWPDGPRGALLLAGLTALALLMAARVEHPIRMRRGLVVALAVLLGALLVRPPLPVPTVLRPLLWPPPGWQLVACDVGQGDGLVLHVAPGTAVVVDAGPDPAAMDHCLHRLGVRQIPLLLLTHFHADHVEGLPGALRGRRVMSIQVSPLVDPPEEAARVARWAAAARVPVEPARPGEIRRVGELRWRVLWPSVLLAGDSPPNNASVVLLVVTPAGLSLLLAGDIEPLAQSVLHQAEPDLRVDVLKVPHHGSAYQDAEFLRSLRARIALVSVGADNDYGHPAARTLDMLRHSGATTLRTDTGGDLAVAVQAGRLRAATRTGEGGGPGRLPATAATTPAATTTPREGRRRRMTGLP